MRHIVVLRILRTSYNITVAEILPIQIHLRLCCAAALLYYSVTTRLVSGDSKVRGKNLCFRARLVWMSASALMLTSCANLGKKNLKTLRFLFFSSENGITLHIYCGWFRRLNNLIYVKTSIKMP